MNIVGIDLGTTFSGLAVLDEIGNPAIIPNSDGDRITPSIIFVDPDEDGKAEVGVEAKRQMVLYPDRMIVEVKREMGTEEVFKVGSQTFTPTEISALILKKLIQDAERIKGKIDEAVVTVPANFLETARRATKDAGEMAGLKKVTLIDEPVAAALLYAKTQEVHGSALVFDLGGGTFDVTIANIEGTDVKVVSSLGDSRLGGKDFDRALAGVIKDEYMASCGEALFDDIPGYELLFQAEDIKKTLSRRDKHRAVVIGPAGPKNLEITRSQFENAISSYLGKIKSVIGIVLDEAGVVAGDIDHVLLVGGSTRIPCVKALLKEKFNKEPEECVNADEAVALGAAIYHGLKVDPDRLNPLQREAIETVNLVNTAPANYGTIAVDDSGTLFNSIIIYKNAVLPCSATKDYRTMSHGQTSVDCSVTQCTFEEENPEYLFKLSEEAMTLPPDRLPGQRIRVTFSYNEEGMMMCEFMDVDSGRVKSIEVDPGGGGDTNYRRTVDPDSPDVSDFLVD